MLKTCPKCREQNGENRTTCYSCGTTLESYKKICRKCGSVHGEKDEICRSCGGGLSVYSPTFSFESTEKESEGKSWIYVLTILIPIVGLILGLIYMGKNDDDGKPLLILSVVLSIVYGFIIFCLL